ncbi:MAG: alpha/beta hydrolase, partial [Myxococcota bacterium]
MGATAVDGGERARFHGRMGHFGRFCGLAAALYAAGILWLVHAERSGPPHHDFIVPPAIPATLTVPGSAPPGRLPEVVPLADRPPAVLLVHGYSNDRTMMRHLGRRLAEAGYGVLSIDVRGHGQNRAPFARDPDGVNLFEDFAAAADWLRAAAWVDGSRLAVVGFSMGGRAAQRFAERDSGVDAAVMI